MSYKIKVEDNQLRLPNGKIITFNEQQYEAINDIRRWLKESNGLDNIYVLSGYAGTGKEQPIDCKVQTPYGETNIGNLKINDEVFGVDGNINKVVGVFPQGKKQAYKIYFDDNTHTECGENHLWNVYEFDNNNQKTLEFNKIYLDYVDIFENERLYKYSIPVNDVVEYNQFFIDNDAYEFGYIIGNDVIKTINITNEYKYIPSHQRIEILRGLMDNYGWNVGEYSYFISNNKEIVNYVSFLIRSLGGVAEIIYNNLSEDKTLYTIKFKICICPYKKNQTKIDKWNQFKFDKLTKKIIKIEKSRIVEQLCISVSSEDGLYLTDNFIVTHNTTVSKKILEEYKGRSIVVSAPTHKAKKVIENATNIGGTTLHSLLGLRPDVSLDEFNPNKPIFNPIALPKICEYSFIIIDEASMINKYLFELIKKQIKGMHTKILFMGDPAQIPPVHESESIIFTNVIDNYFLLSKIERQNDSNPLTFIYDKIRDNLLSPYEEFEKITNINEYGEGVLFLNNNNKFRSLIFEYYESDEYKKNPDYCKLISWTNEMVIKSNKIIRERLQGVGKDVVEVDDVLMGYRSIQKNNYSNLIDNSADYKVVKKDDIFRNKYGINGYYVKLRETQSDNTFKYADVFIVDSNDHINLHNYAEEHDRMKVRAMNNKKLWNAYYEFRKQNLIMTTITEYRNKKPREKSEVIAKDLDYGYCITAHKAQGSTYNTVFILDDDINKNMNVKERNQIKYVAYTRPSKKAIVFNKKRGF